MEKSFNTSNNLVISFIQSFSKPRHEHDEITRKKGLGENHILTSFLVEMVINTSNNLVISIVQLITL